MTAHHSRGPRLFLSDVRFVFSDTQSQILSIPDKESHYLRDVLRLQVGDSIEIGDSSSGLLGEGTINSLTAQVTVKLHRVAPAAQTCDHPLILLCPLLKGEKNDNVCDWATELGCQGIVFWQSSRSIVRLRDERDSLRRQERLKAIALAAAQQSRQPKPPTVSIHKTLDSACKVLPFLDTATKLVCSLESGAAPISSLPLAAQPQKPVIIAVGPEGDFSNEEYQALTGEYGFTPVSLGASVLRSELAIVTALTAVKFAWSARAETK
jgi:16S rRNA (uracil1498-N3)-methyltransferase